MSSLYLIVLSFFSEIMNTQPDLSSACELVSICVTCIITWFILLYPLKLVVDSFFQNKWRNRK